MTYSYPSNDYQRPEYIRSLLGSIWTNFYEGRPLIDAIVRARADIEQQSHTNLKEAEACVGRQTLPVFHKQSWYHLPILLSDLNTTAASLWRFDDPDLPTFNGSPEFQFDYPLASTEFTWQLPDDIVDVSMVTNRITDPSVILTKNLDFRLILDRQGLAFYANPFSNSLFAIRDLFTAGVVSDKELSLWLCCLEIDWDLVYEHFGYVLALKLDASEEYKAIVNCVLDGIAGGTALEQIECSYSMMTGIPLVRETSELVEDIANDAVHLLINTDQHVYKFKSTATASVVVGDTVYDGQPLITGFERLTPNLGGSSDKLKAIVLGKGMLFNEFRGELGFENKTAAVDVSGTPGNERVEWDISGHPLDVELFWDTVHDNRLTYGQSLYDLLKAEDGPFPSTVNPMEFMLENVLRNNTVIFIVDAVDFGDDALGLGPGATLRRIMPPHTTILMVIELSGFSDSVTMDDIDATEMYTFDGMTPLDDAMIQLNTSSYFSCRNVSFTCH